MVNGIKLGALLLAHAALTHGVLSGKSSRLEPAQRGQLGAEADSDEVRPHPQGRKEPGEVPRAWGAEVHGTPYSWPLSEGASDEDLEETRSEQEAEWKATFMLEQPFLG
mmetsp:Transcript_53980/g.173093  ORF Transcript_53980/g.173093 Transcript_53980/m.173093 type:complete len:109 (+) Transcript_53980:72-398(+)